MTHNRLIRQMPAAFPFGAGPTPVACNGGEQNLLRRVMYGVPLRIERMRLLWKDVHKDMPFPVKHNEASVESELALLPATACRPQAIAELFFGSKSGRFEEPLNNQIDVGWPVGRAEPALVRAMIDNALTAERYGFMGARTSMRRERASRATKRG